MSDSFLKTLIKAVRLEFKNRPPALNNALIEFKQSISEKLDELHDAKNLRIFDGQDGGVIRGRKNSREKLETKETGNVLCQKQYFNDNKLEVPYFRSVFNSPAHKFTYNASPNVTVRLIGYESPMMRKTTDRKNCEISPRALSCDLVGLTSDNRVLCIEGKVKPQDQATDIVYGLLESFAYGVCVEYFLSDENRRALFKQEVRACVNEFHPNANDFNEDKLTVAFSLAATKKYFAEYFNPSKITQKKADKRLNEAIILLATFQEIKGPAWAGFLIMDPPCCKESFALNGGKTIAGKEYVEPHFKHESLKIELANDITALKRALGLQGATL